jgi:antitoxin (DNA-binding transcriptional repressor) of toxin-antitoxin stability system
VAGGEEIVIARAGKPVARIVPYEDRPAKRVPGGLAGLVELDAGWDSDETNAGIQALIEGHALQPDAESPAEDEQGD